MHRCVENIWNHSITERIELDHARVPSDVASLEAALSIGSLKSHLMTIKIGLF